MTWLSTWPRYGRPEYAEHTSEAAAEAHAIEVVRSGIAPHARYGLPHWATKPRTTEIRRTRKADR